MSTSSVQPSGHSSEHSSGKSRRIRRILPFAVVLLVLASGCYGFWRQYPAAKVGRACAGLLPVDSILDLSGKSRLSVFGSRFKISGESEEVTGPDDLETHCRAGDADVHIETATEATAQYGIYTFQNEQDALPVPLGAGWQGFMAGSSASVLLNCSNWTAQEGSGILAAISDWEFESTSETRLKLARAVTEMAKNVAKQSGCETKLGSASKLTSPDAAARTKPAGDATGTCEGLSSTAMVRETDAATSPVEECVLIGGLQLRAEYGPFSAVYSDNGGKYGGHETPSGADTYATWTSATCKGALGVGYYDASVVEGSDRRFTSDPLTKQERKDLEHFAEQSAARHGCRTPEALSS